MTYQERNSMTHKEKKRVEALERRRDFLAERVANYRPDGNPSFDKAELGALNWALRIIHNCEQADILKEVS